MKFLCPSCKAKYQIADEKVSGRSVRMKCRKCGYLIHVSSADAESWPSSPPPGQEPTADSAEPSAPPPRPMTADKPAPTEKSRPLGTRTTGVNSPAGAAGPAAGAPPRPIQRSGLGIPRPGGTPSTTGAGGIGSGSAPSTVALSTGASSSGAASAGAASAGAASSSASSGGAALGGAGPASATASGAAANAATTGGAGTSSAASPDRRLPSQLRTQVGGLGPTGAAPKPAGSGGLGATTSLTGTPGTAAAGRGIGGPSTAAASKALGGNAAAAAQATTNPASPKPPSARGVASFLESDFEEEPTRIAAPASALAGAFHASVGAAAQKPAPAPAPAPAPVVGATHVITDPLNLPGDEWFVGINGVPVGPIRLSELRTKAASGAITRESLVWRDGFEEWRPLKNFPELAAIIEESLSSVRASMGGFSPAPVVTTTAPSAMTDPFGGHHPAHRPGVVTAVTAAVTAPVMVTDDLDVPVARQRSQPLIWAGVAVVVAILFGITIGFVLFDRRGDSASRKEEKGHEPVAANQPKQLEPSPTAAPPGPEASAGELTAAADQNKGSARSGNGTKSTTKPEADSKLSGGLKGLGLSGLSAAGPKGPDSTSQAPSGGGQLDQAQVQSAVSRYTPSVKRSCWQPALDTRDKDAPASARVSVAITVGPTGSVQDVNTNGDPRGYRGLANCIASRVRTWQFPAVGSTTTVNVPFVFVSQ